jgi:hypothetical protein
MEISKIINVKRMFALMKINHIKIKLKDGFQVPFFKLENLLYITKKWSGEITIEL